MTLRQAYPLTDALLAATRRPIGVSRFTPASLETELEALVSFMDDAFGPLTTPPEELVARAAERLAPVGELDLALALLCPSDLYLASIGAEDEQSLESELFDARRTRE